MALHFICTVVAWVCDQRPRIFSQPFVRRPPTAHHQAVMGICLSGIRAKKCNASSKLRATKSSLRFCWRQNTMTLCWRCGISPLPFHSNIMTSVVACNDRCIPQTTLCSTTTRQAGRSANQRRNCSAKPKRAPIDISLMSMASGAVPPARHLLLAMD